MSDSQTGPDWWLASDGKWYPPQSRPLPPPPPGVPHWVPPTSSDARIGRALPGWLGGLLWGAAVFAGLTAIFAVQAINASKSWWDGGADSDLISWVDAEDNYSAMNGVFSLISIATFVLLIIWTYRAHVTTSRLMPTHRKWSKGWSIGSWFIPIANFIITPLHLQETWRIARSPRNNGVVDSNWRSLPSDSLLSAWWILYVIGLLLSQGITVANNSNATVISDYTTPMWVGTIGLTCTAAGSVCAALFVKRASAVIRTI